MGFVNVTSIFRPLDVEGKLPALSRKWLSIHKDAGNGCLFANGKKERPIESV
jgi:hypothetical protein